MKNVILYIFPSTPLRMTIAVVFFHKRPPSLASLGGKGE